MALRILKLLLCLLALLVVDGCAKRETKTIGAGDNVTKKDSENQGDGKDSPGDSANADDKDDREDDGPSNGTSEDETYPEGLSKSDYEAGRKYIGAWTGLEDEPDPSGKWTLKAMPNPDSLAGSVSADDDSSGGVSLADVRPVIQNACANCHSPNGSQPTSPMVTDEQLLSQFNSIKSRVRNGSMPPNGGLSPDQKDLIARWSKDAVAGGNNSFQQGQGQQQPGLGGEGAQPGFGGRQ